jgi:hypothetical protein
VFHFYPPYPAKEIPRDGKSVYGAQIVIAFAGSPPPGTTIPAAFELVDSIGAITPESHDVPATQNPVTWGGISYAQPAEAASGEDASVTARGTAGGKSDTDTLLLRGVELQATKEHQNELYSGTDTGKACCGVVVKAYCPANANLHPQGTITATVAPGLKGVYLKWVEDNVLHWSKQRTEPITTHQPPMPPGGPSYSAAGFTVATDNPADLPDRPIAAAGVTFRLNGEASQVFASTSVDVLVPQCLEATPAEKCAVANSQNFSGDITWFADEAATKFYWGAKGTIDWQLPQGQSSTPYHLSKVSAVPCHYASVDTTAWGDGARTMTEEHGYNSGGLPVSVHPNPADKAKELEIRWKPYFDEVRLLGEAFLFFHLALRW